MGCRCRQRSLSGPGRRRRSGRRARGRRAWGSAVHEHRRRIHPALHETDELRHVPFDIRHSDFVILPHSTASTWVCWGCPCCFGFAGIRWMDRSRQIGFDSVTVVDFDPPFPNHLIKIRTAAFSADLTTSSKSIFVMEFCGSLGPMSGTASRKPRRKLLFTA